MPAARKRGAKAASAAPADADAVAPKDNAKLARLLEELDMEIEDRIKAVQGMAEGAAMQLRSEFSMSIMKLPKKVRSMPLSEFREQYAGDISSVILKEVEGRLATSCPPVSATPAPATVARGRGGRAAGGETVLRTTRKRRGAAADEGAGEAPLTTRRSTRARVEGSIPEATPAPTTRRGGRSAAATPSMAFTPMPGVGGRGGRIAATPGGTARKPARGEVFFSQNGSPLGTFEEEDEEMIAAQMDTPPQASITATIAKPARRGRKAEPLIRLKTEDGQEVELSGNTIPAELQNVARGALKGLQTQVAAIMNMLGGR